MERVRVAREHPRGKWGGEPRDGAGTGGEGTSQG